MHFFKGILPYCSLAALCLAACASPTQDTPDLGAAEDIGTAQSKLVPLQESEKLGPIVYGETKTVDYTETPRYRAYSFSGTARDKIDIWVRSNGGGTDAKAFLLAADYSTLVENDNAEPGNPDSHITYQLTNSDTHWIVFREKWGESANFSVSLSKTASGGRVVPGQDRVFSLTNSMNDVVVETWGKGLWEGYASFDAQVTLDAPYDKGTLIDASGTSFPVTGTKVRYERLPLPLTLRATTDSSVLGAITLTQVSYEITQVNPIPQQSLTGKFNGANTTQVSVIGSDIPGVAMNFTAQSLFFQNFTNGNACGRLLVNGEILTPNAANRSLALVAPLTISSSATCVSSPLANPENPNADFALGLSNIAVGDPQ